MSLHRGLSHGRALNPFIQFPEYKNVEPMGLMAYASTMGSTQKTTKKTKSEEEDGTGFNYVPGTAGELNTYTAYHDAFSTQLNNLKQKAIADREKYGSTEKWQKSPEGKKFFKDAGKIISSNNVLKGNIHIMNNNLKEYKRTNEKLDPIRNEYFFERNGRYLLPILGGREGVVNYGEYMDYKFNEQPHMDGLQMKTKNYGDVYSNDFRGTFNDQLLEWYTAAAPNMKEGGPGFNVVNQDGQVKQSASPTDKVAYLLKTQSSNNFSEIATVAGSLGENLTDDARHDLSNQFLKELRSGGQIVNIMEQDPEAKAMIDGIRSDIQTGQEGEDFANNFAALTDAYMGMRIKQVSGAFERQGVESSLGGMIKEKSTGFGEVPMTADQYQDAPLHMVQRGANGQTVVLTSNKSGGVAQRWAPAKYSMWDQTRIDRWNKGFLDNDGKPTTPFKSSEFSRMGVISMYGQVMTDKMFDPDDNWKVWGYTGVTEYSPAYSYDENTGEFQSFLNASGPELAERSKLAAQGDPHAFMDYNPKTGQWEESSKFSTYHHMYMFTPDGSSTIMKMRPYQGGRLGEDVYDPTEEIQLNDIPEDLRDDYGVQKVDGGWLYKHKVPAKESYANTSSYTPHATNSYLMQETRNSFFEDLFNQSGYNDAKSKHGIETE